MQINSNRPADFYPLVPADNRNNARLPAVFDNTQALAPVNREGNDNTTVVVPATRSEDGQQARFVRDFISSDRRFDGDNAPPALLPRAVQQYLYINELPNQTMTQQGQLLDEMV
jgi:hypothetical protein